MTTQNTLNAANYRGLRIEQGADGVFRVIDVSKPLQPIATVKNITEGKEFIDAYLNPNMVW